MAVFESTKLRAHLATLLNIDELEQWSWEAGLCVRQSRRIPAGALVACFVLGSIVLPRRTISALRRLLLQLSGQSCAYSSFYERIGPPLTRVLKRLFTHLLEHTPGSAIPSIFDDRVDEVLALDSCIVRLWDGLCGRWPSTVEGKAGLKLHLVCNVIGATANRLKVGKEPDSENGPWKRLGPWVRNKLLLMDRGYEDFHLFYRIDHNGGFFLTPLKAKRNPRIVKVFRLDDYLDHQMLSHDPGRQFSCDFLNPRPPPPLQDAA